MFYFASEPSSCQALANTIRLLLGISYSPHKWQQIGVNLQQDDFTDMEAVTTVIRIMGGNFRLIHRLCTQIERILQINNLRMVTKEVVEAAR